MHVPAVSVDLFGPEVVFASSRRNVQRKHFKPTVCNGSAHEPMVWSEVAPASYFSTISMTKKPKKAGKNEAGRAGSIKRAG